MNQKRKCPELDSIDVAETIMPNGKAIVCGRTRAQWVEEIKKHAVFADEHIMSTPYGGFKIKRKGVNVDLIVSVYDAPYFEVGDCMCDWHNLKVRCLSDAMDSLHKRYGDFMTPDHNVAQDQHTLRRVGNTKVDPIDTASGSHGQTHST